MTHAFKCDSCNNYYDGHSPRMRDLRVGDYLMRVSFAKLVEKPPGAPEEKLSIESMHIEKLPDHLAALMGVASERREELDGKELHSADFCPDCTYKVLTQALVAAQTEGVAALVTAQLDISESGDDRV